MVVRVEVPADEVDAVSDRLWLAGASAVSEEPLAGADGSALIRLTADLDTCPPEVVEAGWPVEVFADDGAWQDGWRPHARAVHAGPFLVRPPWVPATAPDGEAAIELLLDGGRAFGTGSHPSTTLALELLADVVAPGASVLDAGCGSGALAIGAALLGAGRVVAIDIDPAAVAATRANAAANEVTVDVAPLDVAAVAGTFDVVVANLGAPLTFDLAGVLAGRTAASGALILSGLLDDRAAGVAGAYPGWTIAARASRDGWTAVHLRRQPITFGHGATEVVAH